MPLDNRESERLHMVTSQLEARGIRDPRVLKAMRTVPRHKFIPESHQDQAYDDSALTIGSGQTISQPFMVAVMTELLALEPADRVLEIGTGSGYQAAILSLLAADITSIERHGALAEHARATLADLGFDRVRIVVGDGTKGCDEHAPYDAIVVTAGGPNVPRNAGAAIGHRRSTRVPRGASQSPRPRPACAHPLQV